MRRSLVVMALALIGCVDDPQDPKTWIKKLDDVRESKAAVTNLVRLKDASAVDPLVKLYKKGKDPDVLKAIASFHDKRQVPAMIDAMDYSEESCDQAAVAANALGETPDPSAVDPLIKALLKPLPIKTRCNVVKLESMKSLGKIGDKKAIDALIKVLSTSADDQDFYLNKIAAESLSKFNDPKAVPALVRGLWMTGRGANIFQECRAALLAVGEPSVQPLIDTMQRKNKDVEEDAKKYEFVPGIVVQKVAIVLGDLRSKSAVQPLLAQLAKKDEGLAAGAGKGAPEHQSVILALGQIGDAAALKPLLAVCDNPKADNKDRAAAAEALNLLGDQSALPSLQKLANQSFIDQKTKEIDGEKGALVAAAATALSRLADDAHATASFPKLPADLEESDAHHVFQNAELRLAVVKECKKDVACFAKYLNGADTIKAEKAAFQLARLGAPGVSELSKHVSAADPAVRMTVLFGLSHSCEKGCKDGRAALEKQIEVDRTKPPMKPLVDEMKAVLAAISHG
jgi:HEAT repeat protein